MATRQNITPPSSSRKANRAPVSPRRAKQRAPALPTADRKLFAAYQTFAAAYRKVKEANDAPGRDLGSLSRNDCTLEQKKAHQNGSGRLTAQTS